MKLRGFFVCGRYGCQVQLNSSGIQSPGVQMWREIAVAISLLLVIEGILPFLSPQSWRKMAFSVAQLDDRSLRIMGLVSMLIGVGVLYLING